MAKIEVMTGDVKKTISDLKLYRSGWANDIREGWRVFMPGAQEILFELYEISGCIILSLEDVLDGRFRDKMALHLVYDKLNRLVSSREFGCFDEMGQMGACFVVTSGTKHHIRVMMKTLEVLIA